MDTRGHPATERLCLLETYPQGVIIQQVCHDLACQCPADRTLLPLRMRSLAVYHHEGLCSAISIQSSLFKGLQDITESVFLQASTVSAWYHYFPEDWWLTERRLDRARSRLHLSAASVSSLEREANFCSRIPANCEYTFGLLFSRLSDSPKSSWRDCFAGELLEEVIRTAMLTLDSSQVEAISFQRSLRMPARVSLWKSSVRQVVGGQDTFVQGPRSMTVYFGGLSWMEWNTYLHHGGEIIFARTALRRIQYIPGTVVMTFRSSYRKMHTHLLVHSHKRR